MRDETGSMVFEDRDDGPWVVMFGEIDLAIIDDVTDAFIEQRYRPGTPFTVDLHGVEFLDSSGVAFLMRLYGLERRLRVVGPVKERVRRTLEVSGVDDLLNLPAPVVD